MRPAFAHDAVPQGEARLPVLVWIHGGGNTIGDAKVYDASSLAMSQQVESWLDANKIANYAATPLPSEEYADASHPLGAGYARLAEQVYDHAEFQRWLGGRP